MSLLSNVPDNDFAKIVSESLTIKEIEAKLGYNSYSGCVSQQILRRIKLLGLDTSHFNHSKTTERTPENIFIKDSTASQRTLRKYYKAGGYTKYVCSICGIEPIWNGQKMSLILDHINGRNNDDRISNLRWVCPNCNSLLPTFGGRNKGAYDKM